MITPSVARWAIVNYASLTNKIMLDYARWAIVKLC